jgi:cyclophilin family peptidyl-prolyl cis-trans isomerase
MPHSVYTFMQMVDEGVWDNTVFIHHWNHIVQAAPISPDGENKRDSINGVLSFPEYSDEYKHEQYTLGFSGRPGGPEFYINLDDNDDTHGPGKQEHSTVLNDADPCFAKVVIGKRAVDRLQKTSIEVINEADSDDADSGIAFSSIVSVNLVVSKEKNRRKKITSFDPRFKSGFFAQG